MAWIYNGREAHKDLPAWRRRLLRVGDWAISFLIFAWFTLSIAACTGAIKATPEVAIQTVKVQDGGSVRCLVDTRDDSIVQCEELK